ncbi:MAG: Clp protease N-terminal domain-containing protein [Natronosporangium sp.]
MFERFTNRARAIVVYAQDEARLLRHNYIGTEHILLGLLREGEGVAAQSLQGLEISLENVRRQVEEIIGQGGEAPTGHIPFTPRAKKVLELSLREALQLKHNYIGTEHILLGLIREGEGVAAQVLVRLGADLDRVRQQVVRLLGQRAEPGAPDEPVAVRRRTPAAEHVVAAAERLAGGSPMGSHHLLEALIRSEDSAAAKVFAALGVEAEAVASTIDNVGIDGTTDLTDEEAAARQMEIRVVDGEVRIALRNPAAVELVEKITEHLGGPVRGDDPLAGGLVNLHQEIIRFLTDLRIRVAPSPEDAPDPERSGGGISALIERAIHSRLRRRSRPTLSDG